MISKEVIIKGFKTIYLIYLLHKRTMNYLKSKKISQENNEKYIHNDKKMYEFFLKLEQIRENEKNRKFNKWLNTTIDYNNYYYDEFHDELRGWSDTNVISIKSIVNNFVIDLKKIITQNNYTINNENKFKDEIASFLYKESK